MKFMFFYIVDVYIVWFDVICDCIVFDVMFIYINCLDWLICVCVGDDIVVFECLVEFVVVGVVLCSCMMFGLLVDQVGIICIDCLMMCQVVEQVNSILIVYCVDSIVEISWSLLKDCIGDCFVVIIFLLILEVWFLFEVGNQV